MFTGLVCFNDVFFDIPPVSADCAGLGIVNNSWKVGGMASLPVC